VGTQRRDRPDQYAIAIPLCCSFDTHQSLVGTMKLALINETGSPTRQDPGIDFAQVRALSRESLVVSRNDTLARDARTASLDWSALADSAGCSPFGRPDWILAYLDAFEPNATLARFDVFREHEFIGTLPLLSERCWFHGVPIRFLRAPGLRHAPERFDAVCAGPDSLAVAAVLWESLRQDRGWDVIELVDLPENGPGWRLMQSAEASGFCVGRRMSRRTPFIAIPADASSLEAILPDTSAKFRANVRRRMRNLEKIGPVVLKRHSEFDESLFMRLLALEHAGWKGRNQTSILSDSRLVRFYRSLAQSASANGYLCMYSLECAGEPVAMHLGLSRFGQYLVPKLAFDEGKHEFAPGHLLVSEVLRDCVARRCREFDFLGNEMPWKLEWTRQLRNHHRVHIFNNTVAGRAAYVSRYKVLSGVRALTRFGQGGLSNQTSDAEQERAPS
jgi:CelD/BcsL family acetyltransferase involved in cellulose biosynthesis